MVELNVNLFSKWIGKIKRICFDYFKLSQPAVKHIENYYDKNNDLYLGKYGTIIQAARPQSDNDLVEYYIKSMDIKDGMRLLDAGCGVCGIAIEIAKRINVRIDGITISTTQFDVAISDINENNLTNKISVVKGDYSELHKHYAANYFDLIYFHESLGYADDMIKVLQSASQVLKPGGSIYIKDFFLVPITNRKNKLIQNDFKKEIRKQYLYKVLEFEMLVAVLRELGFYIEFIKSMDFNEDFTKALNYEVSNNEHDIYTKAINNPFQLFEPLVFKFKKMF